MLKINRYILIAIIILIAFDIITTLLYTRSSFLFGGDNDLPISMLNGIHGAFFIWQTNNYSGLINAYSSSAIGIIYSSLFLILQPLGLYAIKYASVINDLIIRLAGSLGMFFFVYYLIGERNKISIFSSFVSSILFTGELVYFGIGNFSVFFMPIVLLSFLFFIRFFDKIADRLMFLGTTVIALAFEFDLLGYSQILQGTLLVVILFIFMPLFSDKNKKEKLIMLSWSLIIILIAIGIFLPEIFFTVTSSHVLNNQVSLLASNSNSDFISDALLLPASIYEIIPYSIDPYIKLLGIASIIVVLFSIFFGFIFAKNKVGKNKTGSIAILGLILALILYIAFSATIHKPFGAIFSYIYSKIPFLLAFRYGEASIEEEFFLVMSLFGVGSYYLIAKLKNLRKYRYLAITLIVAFCLIFLFFNSVLPISLNGVPWTNHLLPFIKTLPSYTVLISNYLNNKSTNFSVATLPSDDDWHLSKWYDAPDIYSSLLNAPVYTGGFTSYNEFFFPQSQDQYGTIARYIEEYNYSGIGVLYALGSLGIKYIIIQGNTSNVTFGPNHPLIQYNFSKIYSNLNDSGATLVKRYASSSIYMNKFAVPLIYPTNIYQSKVNNSINIIELIKNESINPLNFSVYSINVSGPILWYGNAKFFNSTKTVNATTIANFSKPNISFVENTPTKVTVHVSNATTPYYLVFRETYDPHWAAFYSNGTEVNPNDHIAVNGFANAWYMNKTGNYTVTLYYTLQTDAWIAWGVSFAALFVTIGIGVYGWKEKRKAKVRERR